jgi:DNA replication and repair protein RecF
VHIKKRFDMTLTDISILNYKNITEAELSFSPNINCFIGDNGEGKTNLLDAIYFLSFTHSMFSNIDSQMMRHGSEFFMLKGHYLHDDGETTENICASMKRGVKKQFKRNDKLYKRMAEHIGLIPLIIVSPDDVMLVNGGSEERRRLLDIVISQYDNAYIDYLVRYNKALQQRNALLKMEEEPDVSLMELWEEEMAQNGEEIYRRRNEFVERFIPVFNEIYSRISGSKEKVSLRYVSHCQRGPLIDVIQRDRVRDRAVGYSLHGIHRDDMEMLIGEYPMKREGSQGQTKTYVISLKLAQFDFLKRTISKTTPLLLLDDIFDKLDRQRVESIIGMVSGDAFGQIFITDTNREHLDRILAESRSDYKIFKVNNGEFS